MGQTSRALRCTRRDASAEPMGQTQLGEMRRYWRRAVLTAEPQMGLGVVVLVVEWVKALAVQS